MTLKPTINENMIQQWGSKNLDLNQVIQKLIDLDTDEESMKVYVSEFTKLRNQKRQRLGFLLITIGAILGFVSCVITMMNPFPELIGVFLYGFTTVAVTIAFAGFYFLFE